MDTNTLINAMRVEIQQDRLATQRLIQEGFSDMRDALQEHADNDSEQFIDLSERVVVVETKYSTIGKAVWTLFITAFGAATAWALSFIK